MVFKKSRIIICSYTRNLKLSVNYNEKIHTESLKENEKILFETVYIYININLNINHHSTGEQIENTYNY